MKLRRKCFSPTWRIFVSLLENRNYLRGSGYRSGSELIGGDQSGSEWIGVIGGYRSGSELVGECRRVSEWSELIGMVSELIGVYRSWSEGIGADRRVSEGIGADRSVSEWYRS